MHMLRDTWGRVQRDRGPDCLDVLLGDAMAPEEITGDIGAVHLEALIRTRVGRGEAHVVEHRSYIEKLRIECQTTMSASQRAPVVDPAGMVK
jgi:hypothetical protein